MGRLKWGCFGKKQATAPAPTQTSIGPTGIKIWHDPGPKDAIVDIVFIHGLNGHRENTWRYDSAKQPWPQQFLNKEKNLKNARIMTYGYDARVADWSEFIKKVSENGIKQHAQNLLETLASRRNDTAFETRKIIFVCHSLGGIVCKEALVISSNRALEPHLHATSQLTHGVLFLGTPHKGSGLASWAKRLASLVGLVKQTNTRVLEELQKGSHELDRIQSNFDFLLRNRTTLGLKDIQLKCFYEEKSTTGVGKVVDYESAILAGNTPVGINQDHRGMTRFESAEDSGYRLVSFTIDRWAQSLISGAMPAPSDNSGSPSSFVKQLEVPRLDSLSLDRQSTPSSSPSSTSTSSSFVKVPPSGSLSIDTSIVNLPQTFFPDWAHNRERRYYQIQSKEFEEISDVLIPKKGNIAKAKITAKQQRSVMISGLGGAGKTELAYRFATHNAEHFDMVFFVVADKTHRIHEQFSDIACTLGLVDSSERANWEYCSTVFLTWLSNPFKDSSKAEKGTQTVNWLLVLDNAEDTEVVDRFWPVGNTGSILMTTRNPQIPSHNLSITKSIQLHGLPSEVGAQFLGVCAQDSRIHEDAVLSDAMTIVSWVEGYPMAIQQLGCIIHEYKLSISAFLEIYPTKAALFGKLLGHSGDNSMVTRLALDKLSKDREEVFKLLAIMSMLDSEKIDESFLAPRLDDRTPDSLLSTRAHLVEQRNPLMSSSLIDVDKISQATRIHRMVQDVVLEMLILQGDTAPVFKQAIERVGDAWPFLNRTYITGTATGVGRWERCRKALPHILRLKDVYVELNKLQIIDLEAFPLAELLLEAVQYNIEIGTGHEAIPILDLAELIYGSALSESSYLEEEQAKVYRGRVGLAASSKDRETMLEYAQLVYELEVKRHSRTGKLSSMLAVAYNDLATAWAFYEEWEKSIKLLNESKRIRQSLPGFTRDMLFSPLYHLGLVLQHQGKYEEAEEVLNQAMQDREEALGTGEASMSVRSAALYYARGNVKFARADPDRKDLEKSLFDHQEAVSRARQSVGPTHRATLLCKYQVARVSARLGDHKKACELLQDCLEHTIDARPYWPDTVRSAWLYSKCFGALGDAKTSSYWRLRCLEIYSKLCPQHRRTTGTLTEDDVNKAIPYDFL